MFKIKLLLFSAFILLSSLLAANVGDYKNIYIKAFRCNGSERLIYQNYSCFAKSYSRNYSTANAYALAKFPLYNLTFSGILYFKYGVIYRQVLPIPDVSWCDFNEWLSNIEKAPSTIVAKFIQMLKASAPGLIHECPYSNISLQNFSLNIASIPDIFPSGDYRLYTLLKMGDEKVCQVTTHATVESTNRQTFG